MAVKDERITISKAEVVEAGRPRTTSASGPPHVFHSPMLGLGVGTPGTPHPMPAYIAPWPFCLGWLLLSRFSPPG
jgi:hypothetical protein